MTPYNIMIDPLPSTVSVDGRDYAIASDFRTSILFELMMQDSGIDHESKVANALRLYYGDEIPRDVDSAVLEIVNFYSCNRLDNLVKDAGKKQANIKRVYDFDIDAPYIYAAFLREYRIDLQDVDYLHWWKFQAMFFALPEDNEICKIMQYRAVDLSKIKNKEEKMRYAKLQARYRLPDERTTEEKQHAIGAFFGGMMNVK